MRGEQRLHQKFEPTYKVLSKKKERTIETLSLRFSPADKGYLRPHERVNLYDEQGRRQGKHVSQKWVYDERLIIYFQDDLPMYRVKYKILPALPTEKIDIKYFALNCHKFVETTYYPNGKKQEEVFFDDKGEPYLRTRWNEAGKPVFLGK